MAAGNVAAWVGGLPVPAASVERRLCAVRDRSGALLPPPATAEERQLRRWVAQVVVTERLLEHLAAELGVQVDPGSTASWPPSRAASLELGGVLAAALAATPVARRLYEHVVGDVRAGQDEVRAYYDRNSDEFGGRPFREVRAQITTELTQVEQRRRFVDWLDARRRELVRLAAGFEHPGDPRQPDATHRH
jgi:[acyl-carrier-protein] S-malonyltransferase